MKVFLAGVAPWRNEGIYDATILEFKPYILESFYYVDEHTERLIPLFGDFLLDSGAFTFFTAGKTVDWVEYIKRYAAFIRKNDIKHFFELDIDVLVGYDKVLEFRELLEAEAGRKCIPVWHKSRGLKEWEKMCIEYDYVAIGGIVSKEFNRNEYKLFPKLIRMAHKYGAKVHGLGFTALSYLPNIHFDSVDSTSWTTGNRFGCVYKFNGNTMTKIDVPKNHRIADPRKVAVRNFTEWLKFQRWAKTHL